MAYTKQEIAIATQKWEAITGVIDRFQEAGHDASEVLDADVNLFIEVANDPIIANLFLDSSSPKVSNTDLDDLG